MREKANNINMNTITLKAFQGLSALDNSFVGTEHYLGIAMFWPVGGYKFHLRGQDATPSKLRRVHGLLMDAGVPVQETPSGRWIGDGGTGDVVTQFVHEAYRTAIKSGFGEDMGGSLEPTYQLQEERR